MALYLEMKLELQFLLDIDGEPSSSIFDLWWP